MKIENKVEPRYTFSINLPISLYQKLANEAGRGKVSTFIRKLLEEKLAESEDKLAQEYQECYANPRMIKEAKQWEKAGTES
jgi:metal-responsive CopG/Arc/MetJ family transcriptional regulator